MCRISAFLLFFFLHSLYAEEAITFKKELVASNSWTPYGIILLILVMALLVLAKNSKRIIPTNNQCRVVEKISVHHKTKVYVIAYQDQKFLVADNQNSLAIHALKNTSTES
ncbi:hypothetical protein [Legionella fallonii]|uniref:Flagellar protein n=1 Tax=Legionella fallonii LLAP-10 TaxID=1212491 RepID=A0A098G659_9GAMM|nr:hypothetical protein [Legionella fallonii]CEG57454.1 conserved exported protein of unknown function [Legionella fallonii LLAP-10]